MGMQKGCSLATFVGRAVAQWIWIDGCGFKLCQGQRVVFFGMTLPSQNYNLIVYNPE